MKENKKYKVLIPFSCPNSRVWHEMGDELSLLACEADFLLLSNKVEIVG